MQAQRSPPLYDVCEEERLHRTERNEQAHERQNSMGLKFNDLYPSRFFKAEDVEAPLVVKIKELVIEKLDGESDEQKPVLYFVNQAKSIVLNKTNATTIINLTGSDDVDDWIGVRIELYKDTVLFHGQRTPCVRIRAPREKKSGAQISDTSEDDIPDSKDDEPMPRGKRSKSAA
jgi:hypothetical protein